MTTLPTDSQARKDVPLLGGLFRYFPAALAGVARWSKLGNDKHNPGEPLHHARGKSMDHGDCILRHLMDMQDLLAVAERGPEPESPDALPDAVLCEADALAWRALVLSQELHERFGGAPLAPGAKLPECRTPMPAKLPETSGHVRAAGGGNAFTKAAWLCPEGDCCRPQGHAGEHIDR